MYTFTGTPHQRGQQHGQVLAAEINDRVRRSLPPALDPQQRHLLAQPWLDGVEELNADLVQEMAGIAAGSDLTLAEIVLLNSFEAFKVSEEKEKGGCTVVGVATENRTVLAQNWDANDQRAIGLAVHYHRDPDMPDVAMLASPGGLGWVGMNEYGLALVNNDLLGGPIARTAPSQAIRRFLLTQQDTSSAVAAARNIPHPAVRSYVLADPTGVIAALEVLPGREEPAVTTATSVAHANHAVSPRARAVENRSKQEEVFPSSAHRAERATVLLDHSVATDEPSRLLEILRDHDGLPLSICRHPHPSEVTSTIASVVLDCTKRRAEFLFGRPCAPDRSETVRFGEANYVSDTAKVTTEVTR